MTWLPEMAEFVGVLIGTNIIKWNIPGMSGKTGIGQNRSCSTETARKISGSTGENRPYFQGAHPYVQPHKLCDIIAGH